MEHAIAKDIESALSKLESLTQQARSEMEERQLKMRQRKTGERVLKNATQQHQIQNGSDHNSSQKFSKELVEIQSQDSANTLSMPSNINEKQAMKDQLQTMLQDLMTLRRQRESLEQRIEL